MGRKKMGMPPRRVCPFDLKDPAPRGLAAGLSYFTPVGRGDRREDSYWCYNCNTNKYLGGRGGGEAGEGGGESILIGVTIVTWISMGGRGGDWARLFSI